MGALDEVISLGTLACAFCTWPTQCGVGAHNLRTYGHLYIGIYLGRSHVGSNSSNYKIIKVSLDVHRGEHP